MRVVFAIAILALGACGTNEPEKPQVSELAAAAVVRAIYPGIDAPPVANCIVDEATDAERDGLAVTNSENSQARFDIVRAVIARPATQQCISNNNVTFPEPPILLEDELEGDTI